MVRVQIDPDRGSSFFYPGPPCLWLDTQCCHLKLFFDPHGDFCSSDGHVREGVECSRTDDGIFGQDAKNASRKPALSQYVRRGEEMRESDLTNRHVLPARLSVSGCGNNIKSSEVVQFRIRLAQTLFRPS